MSNRIGLIHTYCREQENDPMLFQLLSNENGDERAHKIIDDCRVKTERVHRCQLTKIRKMLFNNPFRSVYVRVAIDIVGYRHLALYLIPYNPHISYIQVMHRALTAAAAASEKKPNPN